MGRRVLRVFLVLLTVLLVLLGGVFLYTRYVVGAVVNVPLAGLLGSVAPGLFPPPRADVAALAQRLRVPEGFAFTVFARDIDDARMLRVSRTGDVLVSSPAKGAVWLLRADRNGDGVADGVRLLLRGLDGPNGLDFHDRFLYVAEQGRVGRIGFDHLRGVVTGRYETVIDDLPRGGGHWKKTIRFGPDGGLYVAIGSSCNVCIEEDRRRATLMRFAADGSGGRILASGLRNSAGFDWRPADGALFATDNGRDLLGDDFPPCELNQLVDGGFYGWPFVNGMGVADPDLGAGRAAEIASARSPVFGFRAHTAPLGILFLRQDSLGASYRGAALVALHGSWNRSRKDGYEVVSLHWDSAGKVTSRPFFDGFLQNDRVLGRPAELAQGPDGAIYVSDDFTGAVYRIAPSDAAAAKAGTGQAEPVSPAAADVAAVAAAQERAEATTRTATAVAATPAGAGTPSDATAMARDGEALFAGSGCTACHLAPNRPPTPSSGASVALLDLGARYDLAGLQAFLARPTPPMPPVADPAERRALAHYLLAPAAAMATTSR